MAVEWTAEMVLALAPDPASAKAGQGLMSARKWSNLGRSGPLIWGECQGSGANPYQTKVDTDGPAYSCSCPSRKFPCKHSLGLMLLWTAGPGALTEGAPPAWVASWVENREKKAEKAKEKQERGPAPVDLAAQARREAARASKVEAGLDDLALWIADLVRQGFAALGARSGNIWDEQARRMIDAQAPGIARRLRQIDGISHAGQGWQTALLDRLARLYLLNEGYRRRDNLPTEVVEDIRSTIGFNPDLDAVRAGPGVRDHWQVLGQAVAVEDRLTVLRTWLIGRDTGRPALVLDFAAGGKPLELSLPPGIVVDADLAFFAGSLPLRALVKERHATPATLDRPTGGTDIAGAFAAYGAALAKNPWIELYPIILEDVVLQESDGAWSARDVSGALMPLAKRFELGWHLLALEGGGPITLTGEFDGATLDTLGCRAGGLFFPLVTTQDEPLMTGPASMPVSLPMLEEATASAIVGVDRRPAPTPPDDPLGKALSGLEAREPASRLLAIAASASLYGRAGRKPAIDPLPAPPICPTETQAECSPEAAHRLRSMFMGDHFECFPEWLSLLAASGRRLPYDAIVSILVLAGLREMRPVGELQVGARTIRVKGMDARAAYGLLEGISAIEHQGISTDVLRKVLGIRGRWVAAKNPKWQKFAGVDETADATVVWETGTRPERLALLKMLRATDPARAREFVASTFNAEPANLREAFLAEFTTGLSPEDEPFLEAALDDRGKEVRRQAADLLQRLPGSALCRRMLDRVRSILRWDQDQLVVDLPPTCDKALIRDGVELKPAPHVKLGEREWWLREIVSAVPPAEVSKLLGVEPARIIAGAPADWRESLRYAWAVSAARHFDADWAEALLASGGPSLPNQSGGNKLEYQLQDVLSPERRDGYLLRLLRENPGPFHHWELAFGPVNWVGRTRGTLGVEVGREVLERVRLLVIAERIKFTDPENQKDLYEIKGAPVVQRSWKYHDEGIASALRELADILPFDLVDEAAAGVVPTEEPRLFYDAAHAAMVDRLKFRRDMHREFPP
jgi:hypothetical protein